MSLIVFGFRKASFGGDDRALWSLLGHVYWLFAGFHTTDSVLDDTLFRVLYYLQLFCFVFETKPVSLPILFFQFLNKLHPLCIHDLLTTVLIAQDGYVFLLLNKFFKPYNLSTYAIDYSVMIGHEGTSAYPLVYSTNLFLTYCQLLLQWHLKSSLIIHGKFDCRMPNGYTIKKLF